jgi:hypothetical protein
MQHGSSEEEDSSEEEARSAQDRRREEADRQEDRRGKAQTSCEEKVTGEGAGAIAPAPALPARSNPGAARQSAYPEPSNLFLKRIDRSMSAAYRPRRLGSAMIVAVKSRPARPRSRH